MVLGVAEASGAAADILDEPVGAFGAHVGDVGAAERFDLGPPVVDGLSESG